MTACKGDGEIPLAHLQLGGESVSEVWLYGAENHTVVTVNLPVVVGIGKLGITGFWGESVHCRQLAHILPILYDTHELQTVEGTECFTFAENLLVVCPLDDVVGLAHVGDFVLVVGEVGRGCPLQVTTFEQGAVHSQFDTLVLHVAHVLQLAGHTIGKAHRYIEQEIRGLLVIEIEHHIESSAPKSEVCTEVVGCGGFPLQVVVCGICFGIGG